jgi:hypothetical protein
LTECRPRRDVASDHPGLRTHRCPVQAALGLRDADPTHRCDAQVGYDWPQRDGLLRDARGGNRGCRRYRPHRIVEHADCRDSGGMCLQPANIRSQAVAIVFLRGHPAGMSLPRRSLHFHFTGETRHRCDRKRAQPGYPNPTRRHLQRGACILLQDRFR